MRKSIGPDIVKELKRKLKQLEKDYRVLDSRFQNYRNESIKWSWEDFQMRAKDIGYKISKAKCYESLYDMISNHDASIGIYWETLDYYIEEYGTKLKK